MFENAGRKLKTCAKVVFWIGAVASGYIGLTIIRASIEADGFWGVIVGLIVAGVGVIVSYLSILLLLAFGELVESSAATTFYGRKITEELRDIKKNQLQTPATTVTPQKTDRQVTNADFWYCSGCGAENKTWYGTCSKCGKRKDN